MSDVKTNSLKAWFLAARPKTLTGAIAPVMVAVALAYADVPEMFSDDANGCLEMGLSMGTERIILCVLCFLFAMVMQIDANFINDYFDFRDGIDNEERLGPKRACQQGWITLPAMERGIIITTIIAVLIGLPTIIWGGWGLILIGLLCVVFAFLYTTTLSRLAMGDFLVLVFFGIVPVCTTYYLLIGSVTTDCLLLSLGMGIVTDLLLIVNNYRDYETDLRNDKITLVGILGRLGSRILYILLGYLAAIIAMIVISHHTPVFIWMLMNIYVMWHCKLNVQIFELFPDYNKLLATTAFGILLYALLVSGILIFIGYSPNM